MHFKTFAHWEQTPFKPKRMALFRSPFVHAPTFAPRAQPSEIVAVFAWVRKIPVLDAGGVPCSSVLAWLLLGNILHFVDCGLVGNPHLTAKV